MNLLFKTCAVFCFLIALLSCEKEKETEYIRDTITIQQPLPSASEKMSFSSNPLVFIKGETTTKKVVITSSDSILHYSVLQVPDWLFTYGQNGVIYNLHDYTIQVDTFNRTFPYGITRDSIEFYTKYGRTYLEVQFIDGNGEQIIVEDTIEIGEISNAVDFTFFNRTNDSLAYSLSGETELTITPASGIVDSYTSEKINVSVDRTQLNEDTTFFTINLSSPNIQKEIVVRVLSYFEDKISLNGNVIDVAYEKNTRKLYYLNDSPNQLVKFDPQNNQTQILSLNHIPYCLDISSSGNFAVVANDGNATLINLSTFSVIHNFSTATRPSDVLLKDSAFVYLFPEDGTHVKIQCIDLQNNYSKTSSLGWSVYDKSKGKLHPTQDAIYLSSSSVSPTDVDKFDISNGTANRLYDSPYHGDYYMGGDLWISQNGNRLFTRGRTILQTTSNQSTDLTYAGRVPFNIPPVLMDGKPDNYFVIQSMDEDLLNDKLLIAAEDDSYSEEIINQVYIHRASNLQYLQSFNLEDFVVPNHQEGKYDHFRAEPIFTCFTGYGNEILVLTKGTGSGLLNQWGIELINP